MKVQIEYRYGEEEKLAEEHFKGPRALNVLLELDRWLRDKAKHSSNEQLANNADLIRSKLYEFMNDEGLVLHD